MPFIKEESGGRAGGAALPSRPRRRGAAAGSLRPQARPEAAERMGWQQPRARGEMGEQKKGAEARQSRRVGDGSGEGSAAIHTPCPGSRAAATPHPKFYIL